MDADNRRHRKSVRRKGYDYRDGGMYYVTICADQRECIFGEIRNGVMGLNEWGCIVADELQKTPILRPYVTLDTWIIMPNHVHVIFYLGDRMYRNNTPDRIVVGAWCAMPLPAHGTNDHPHTNDEWTGERHFAKPIAGSLSTIIGSFKSVVTKRINELRNAEGEPIWQRNFYEHIIRTPEELDRIRSYILHNPRNWLTDEEYDE